MRTIHKYSIPIKQNCSLVVPFNYQIVKVGVIKSVLYVWIEHTTTNHTTHSITLELIALGTGDNYGDMYKYIDTAIDYTNDYIWHVFKREY